MRKLIWVIFALSAATVQASPAIRQIGAESVHGQTVNAYSNFVPYLAPRRLKTLKAAPPGNTARVQGSQGILSYDESAHQKLADRWVNHSSWDASSGRYLPTQTKLSTIMEEQARLAGIDPLIIELIVEHESAFNPSATSHCGAQGLMQLMPQTAAELGVTDAYDPLQNVSAGTRYFTDMYRQFGDLSLALAAYNAGPGCVASYGCVPPIAETQNYVASIGSKYVQRRKRF